MKSILFVCTGNIFRSMSAALLFENYLKQNNITDWVVESAGTSAHKQPVHEDTSKTLLSFGVDCSSHDQTKLTHDIIQAHDIIIAMGEQHKEYIQNTLNHKLVFLYNELVTNSPTSVKDIWEVIPKEVRTKKRVSNHVKKTVTYINTTIPRLFEVVNERYYLFEDFVQKKISHRNGYPFIPLCESKRAIAFSSLDIPYKHKYHVLVIPKKRYVSFTDIPKQTVSEMNQIAQQIGLVLQEEYDGFNILLNDGISAGQYIYHSHMHIIPRMKNDGLVFESWDKKMPQKNEFIKYSKQLQKKLKRFK